MTHSFIIKNKFQVGLLIFILQFSFTKGQAQIHNNFQGASQAHEFEMLNEFNRESMATESSLQQGVLTQKNEKRVFIEPYSNSQPLDLRIMTTQYQYNLHAPTENSELLSYESLTESDKLLFLQKRQEFLKLFIKSIDHFKFGYGFGIEIKNQIKFIKSKITNKSLDSELSKSVQIEKLKYALVKNFDHLMWQQAQLFAKANEIGLALSINLISTVKTHKNGIGGSIGFGLSVGFNLEEHSVVTQIYKLNEKFESSLLKVFAVAGVTGKAGVYIVSDHDKIFADSNKTFYPPIAPNYIAKSDKKLNIGFASGLTMPPPPFSDAFTYQHQVSEQTLLKISMSRANKYFAKVNIAEPQKWFKIEIGFIKDLILKIKNWRSQKQITPSNLMCMSLFGSTP